MALSEKEKELVNIYKQAQDKIHEDIQNIRAAGNSMQFKSAMLYEVKATLAGLEKKANGWMEENIPELYQKSVTEANASIISQIADAKLLGDTKPFDFYPDEFAIIHREAINALIDAKEIVINQTIKGAGRRLEDVIKKVNKEAITTKILTGSTVKKTKELLIAELKKNGVQAIKRKDGSYMTLEAYAKTVARSTTREASNLATINQTQAVGSDLVKMSEHFPTCPVCLPLQGRVYSISGKSNKYPPLAKAYTGQYANIHPNCRHVLNPYIEEFKSEEELKQDLDKSKKSFDINEWTPTEQRKAKMQLDVYNAEQDVIRKRYTDRKQYQRYKAVLNPDEMPKSFSGFRAMKKYDSESYKNIKSAYQKRGQIIKQLDHKYIVYDDIGNIRGFQTNADAVRYMKAAKGKGLKVNRTRNSLYLEQVNRGAVSKPLGVLDAPSKVSPGLKTKATKAATEALGGKTSNVVDDIYNSFEKRMLENYQNAVNNEPEITKALKGIADKTNTEMAGLKYRLKTEESYIRKIKDNYSEGDLGDIKDIVRYTYTTSDDKITYKTQQIIGELEDQGYEVIKIKNYWLDDTNPYNGINTVMKSPSGQVFEIQYHTPYSLEIKEIIHEQYEIYRELKPGIKKDRLLDAMFSYSDTMKLPPDIDIIQAGIKGTKPQPATLRNLKKTQDDFYNTKHGEFYKRYKGTNVETAYIDNMKEVLDNSNVSMRVPDENVLKKILDDGKFKTQFETNTSRGMLSTDVRKEASAKLFGSEVNDMNPSEFEIYGYMGPKDTASEIHRFSFVDDYGDIIITFKDDIRDRTTFTIGDSLNFSYYDDGIPALLNDPQITSASFRTLGTIAQLENPVIDTFLDKVGVQYVEAQMHGGVTLKDIKRITFDGETRDKLKKLGILEKLDELKIPYIFAWAE